MQPPNFLSLEACFLPPNSLYSFEGLYSASVFPSYLIIISQCIHVLAAAPVSILQCSTSVCPMI